MVEYREIECKSALNRVRGMPFSWSLNPYRGCAHGCHYCFARPTHRFFDLGIGEDFTGIVYVKRNLAAVLAGELARPKWAREQVALGTATDPYQPAEGRYRLTRAALEQLARFRTPVSLLTKNPMIVRDIDLLQEVEARAGLSVCFSTPTVDEEIWRRTEPGTAPPLQRLAAMRRLVDAGINAGVLMAPLLPGLSADRAQVERTVQAAAEHGACFVGSNVLNLSAELRGYYFGFLRAEYPELLDGYRRLYGEKYAPKRYRERVAARVDELRQEAGIVDRPQPPRPGPPAARQLGLALP
ncbi:MAG: DNA repair photolyase [Chloroflexi bacterium]|nr:MAG: DNA repair photolyase [Chloroflexota bacterium]